MAIAKLAKFLRKILPLAFRSVRVEDILFPPGVPALYPFSDVERGVETCGE
jgi:hypothetical protein